MTLNKEQMREYQRARRAGGKTVNVDNCGSIIKKKAVEPITESQSEMLWVKSELEILRKKIEVLEKIFPLPELQPKYDPSFAEKIAGEIPVIVPANKPDKKDIIASLKGVIEDKENGRSPLTASPCAVALGEKFGVKPERTRKETIDLIRRGVLPPQFDDSVDVS